MNSNDQISLNFCYSEFTASKIAEGFHIDNSIHSEYVKLNIHALVTLLLQPLRDALQTHQSMPYSSWNFLSHN